MQPSAAVENVGRPSIVGGIAIIAGTAIGAGMFSLPVVSAGMGFFWSLLCLLLTWFCMLHAGLFILEINLNFPPGSSFDTFIGQTLGPRWNLLNNLTLVFVLYILCYAFISGGGSIVSQTLQAGLGLELSPMISGVLFSALIALVVWLGTAMVSRITAIIIGAMAISFALSIAPLISGIKPALLLDVQPGYLVYSFAALPIYLASFGFHGIVPSLPPTIASMFFPNGFIFAIGFAGLFSTAFTVFIPAMAAQASRGKLGNPWFRVWGGNGLIYFLFAYGTLIAICHLLATAGWLPLFG